MAQGKYESKAAKYERLYRAACRDLEGLRGELDDSRKHSRELADELYASRVREDRLQVELDRLHNALAKEMGESS